jgi:dihydroflavonol-4-reductase
MIFVSMPVFVTGATGFIGSHLVEALVQNNEQVYALARKTSNTDRLKRLGVKLIDGDVTDASSLKGVMRDCQTVYHLANRYEMWLPDKSLFYKVNVEGTKNVLNEAMNAGVEKVVYTSAAEALGEKKGEIATEETRHSGIFLSEHCRTKYLGLMEAMKLADRGLPLVVTMPCAVIGPGDFKATGKIILGLLNQKLPGIFFGDSSIAFIYVKDIVEGHMLAAKKGKVGEKYILSSEILKVRDFFETICNIGKVPMPKREISPTLCTMLAYMMEFRAFFTKNPPQMPRPLVRVMSHGMMFDNSKAKRDLGMKFTPIKEALAETVAWYRAQGYAPASEA